MPTSASIMLLLYNLNKQIFRGHQTDDFTKLWESHDKVIRIYCHELYEILFTLSLTIATSPSMWISHLLHFIYHRNGEIRILRKMKLFLFLAASALAQDVDVCKDNCESRHEAELARCNGDQQCIDHANDMFRRCLHDCDNGGHGPPSCTDNCDRRLQDRIPTLKLKIPGKRFF